MQRTASTVVATSRSPFPGLLCAVVGLFALLAVLLAPPADRPLAPGLAAGPAAGRSGEDLPALVQDWTFHGPLSEAAALVEANFDQDFSEERESGRRPVRLEPDDRAIVRRSGASDEFAVPLVRLVAAPSRAPPRA